MGNKCNENEGTSRVGIQIMIPISYLTEYKSFYSIQHWEAIFYFILMVSLDGILQIQTIILMYLNYQVILYEKKFEKLMHIILAFMFQKCSFVNEARQKHTWLLGNVWM